MKPTHKLVFVVLACFSASFLAGCAEEKMDSRVEQAVLKQNQGQRDRDAQQRGGAGGNPNAPDPRVPDPSQK